MFLITLVNILLLYLVGIPITTLFHEMGHALGLLLFTNDSVAKVYLGDLTDANKETFRLGRIHFHIRWGPAGFCEFSTNGDMTKVQRVCSLFGGPLISLILCLIQFVCSFNIEYLSFFITGILYLNFTHFLFTIIPMKYPTWVGRLGGMSSDGLKILEVIKEK